MLSSQIQNNNNKKKNQSISYRIDGIESNVKMNIPTGTI